MIYNQWLIYYNCLKSVQRRIFFWPEYRKRRTRKSSVFGHFSRSLTKITYNIRNFHSLYLSNKRTVKFRIEIITYKHLQIWHLLKQHLLLKYSNQELRNGKQKRVYVRYAKPVFHMQDLFEYNYLRMHDRPNNAVVSYGGCLCDNLKPSSLPLLIFNWRTFSRRVTACWWRREQKIQCWPIRIREIGGVRLQDGLYVYDLLWLCWHFFM